MPILDAYTFGSLSIDGTPYTKDVLIYPDGRIHSPWWRQQGHVLVADDMRELILSGPEIIVIGTGASGFMKPASGLVQLLADKAIECILERTGVAVQTYNRLAVTRKVGGCFHLTC